MEAISNSNPSCCLVPQCGWFYNDGWHSTLKGSLQLKLKGLMGGITVINFTDDGNFGGQIPASITTTKL